MTTNETTDKARRRIHDALTQEGVIRDLEEGYDGITENAQKVLDRRYLAKDREGNILEDTDGMFRRVAHNLAQADINYGATPEEVKAIEDKFFEAMRRLETIPNSPTLMNAGRELQQLSACFVLPVEDTIDGIFESVKQTALIHKSGGGTGFSFSRLRPSGDMVGTTGGVASGPVSFIRAFDTATDVVKQGGTRRGANMAILRVDHPDILEFIRSKKDGVNLSNFNISVAINHRFMEKAHSNENYELVNPHSRKVVGTLNAGDVFSEIVQMAWETGDPGIVFLDRINRDNPNPQLGEIESTNPCGEQPLLPNESCNLASINLVRMLRHDQGYPEIDWEALNRTVSTTVHLLDNVIDMNRYPLPDIEEMSRKTRRIGVGVMGFADILIQMGFPYDSQDALDLAEKVMKFIQEKTHESSGMLAGVRGNFPAWEGSIYGPTGENKPMRNSAPVTIAPTGTISIIAGASSGIEPLFALSYVRDVMDHTRLVEVNPYLEAVAKHEGFYSEELMKQLAQTGTLKYMDVPEWVAQVFQTSQDISPTAHVKMQAVFQRYTDNSVSKTINFAHDATIEDVRRAYLTAYNTGCKGVTVYRDGSKAEQVLSTGQTGETQDDGPEMKPRTQERPREVRGVTERIRTGHGNLYVTTNFDEQGNPFEVFTTLGKAGGCDSAQLEAISRLISMALRSGLNIDDIIYNLKGITCCPAFDNGVKISSAPDAVAISLERQAGKLQLSTNPNGLEGEPAGINTAYQPALTAKSQEEELKRRGLERAPRCPDCNTVIQFKEGCASCPDPSCGWNRCD